MLKSISIFLWLFMLILLWVYIFWGTQDDSELNTKYSQYLSGALSKYTRTYSVEFQTEDFLAQNTTSNQEFIEQLNQKESETQTHTDLLSYNKANDKDNMGSQWNFWTPNLSSTTDSETINWWNETSCNWWLIYDPCLVLWKPIKASGWMNFGSQKYN